MEQKRKGGVPCIYVYSCSDKAVLLKKREVGSVCRSPYTRPEWKGNCYAHAVKLGIVEKEDEEVRKIRISNGKKKAFESRKRTAQLSNGDVSALSSSDRKRIDRETIMSSEISGDDFEILLKKLGGCRYDLQDEYNTLLKINPLGMDSNYIAKIALANWLVARQDLRTPKIDEDVASILGVSIDTIRLWKKKPEIQQLVTSIQVKIISPLADKLAMVAIMSEMEHGIGASKLKAVEMWYKIFKRFDPNADIENNKKSSIPHEMFSIALSDIEDSDIDNRDFKGVQHEIINEKGMKIADA